MHSTDATMGLVAEVDARRRMTVLFDDSYADLVRFVRARCSQERVDDVVAQTYLTAWRRFDIVPAELDAARAWLFTAARNLLLNDARAASRDALPLRLNVPYSPEDRSGKPPDPLDINASHLDNEVAARLDMAAAFRALSPADQEVLALTAVDGLTVAEAATVLGLSPNTFAARLSRARARLRTRLGTTGTHTPGATS